MEKLRNIFIGIFLVFFAQLTLPILFEWKINLNFWYIVIAIVLYFLLVDFKNPEKAKMPIEPVSNGIDLSRFTPEKPSKEFFEKFGCSECQLEHRRSSARKYFGVGEKNQKARWFRDY